MINIGDHSTQKKLFPSYHTTRFVGTSQSNMYWMETDSFASELRNTCHYERINQVIFPRGEP